MGMRSGRTFGEVTQEIRSDLPSLQKALAMPSSEKRQKPKKAPNPGGNPGNPQKWAKTEDTEQPKGRGRGKGKGKGKTGKPKEGDRRNQSGQDSQEDWGDWSWNQSSWSQNQGSGKQWSWENAKKEDRPARDSAGPRQRQSSQAGDPTTRPKGREARRAMSSRPLGQNPWGVTLRCSW